MNEVFLICSYRTRKTSKIDLRFIKHKRIEYLPEVEHIAKTIPRAIIESTKIENGISIYTPYQDPNLALRQAQIETQYVLECSLGPSSEEKYVYTYHFLMADGSKHRKEFRFGDASISMTKRQTISPSAAVEFDKPLPFSFSVKRGLVRYRDFAILLVCRIKPVALLEDEMAQSLAPADFGSIGVDALGHAEGGAADGDE